MQRIGAELRQRFHGGGHRGPDAAAALGKAFTPFGGNAEDITKGIVDAARCGIQIRVHTDGRDAIFHQQRGYIVGVQAFDGVEDDRVMADDELAVVFHSLPHDGGGNVQRGQHAVHRRACIDEQADVIPIQRQRGRRDRLQQAQNLLYRY